MAIAINYTGLGRINYADKTVSVVLNFRLLHPTEAKPSLCLKHMQLMQMGTKILEIIHCQ